MEKAKELIEKYEKISPKIIPEHNTTPEDALKESISSPSIEDPASQPTTDLCPKRKKFGDTEDFKNAFRMSSESGYRKRAASLSPFCLIPAPNFIKISPVLLSTLTG